MSECLHAGAQMTRRTIANGSVQFVKQCPACGKAVGNPVSRSVVKSPDALPAFDDQMPENYAAERAAEARQMQAARQGEWWDAYRAYLASPQWSAKRRAALERDSYLCQGCHQQRATEVHHLTYARVGRELLFDLVSLCESCHEVAHEDDERPRNV